MFNYAKEGFVPEQHAIVAIATGDAGGSGDDFTKLLARYGVYPVHDSASVAQVDVYRAKLRARRPPYLQKKNPGIARARDLHPDQ